MIQRIQSFWLFLATTIIFSLLLFPYLQLLNTDGTATAIKVTGVYQNINGQGVKTQEFLALTIITVLMGMLPFLVIFQYKNRRRQLFAIYIIIALIVGYALWMYKTAMDVIGDSVELTYRNYGIGVLLPVLAIVFLLLAVRGIRHDDKLIRSSERLR